MIEAPRPRIADWLAGPIKANRGLLGQVVLAAVMINLFGLATSLFSMTVYNKIVPNNATDSLIALLIGVLIVVVFDTVLRTLRGYFVDVAGQNIDQQLGAALYDKLLTMKLGGRKGSTGAMAGLLREFETLREFFASATLVALVDVPFILLFLAVIWMVAGPLVWVTALAVPVVVIIGWATQPLIERLSAQSLTQAFSKQGVIVETVSGLETVKSSGAGPMLTRRWLSAVSDHAASTLKQRLVAAIALNAAITAQSLTYVLTVTLGVFMIAEHQLTTGALIAASILSGRCVAPLAQIASLLSRISHTRHSYRALDAMMALPGDRSSGDTLRRPRLHGAIEFRNVTFRYPGSTQRALDNVTFAIHPGERVAIIGRVGSGKSTITRLALGLYEPEDGAVLIDGSDIRQIHPDDLRANIGAVLQDVVLMSGSVRENIALGRAGIEDEDVLRAARISGTNDFMGAIPNGYDLKLADRGEGLSGGQRQSIAVARALAGKPPILLFDEPTSAMDTQSEHALITRLEAELQGRSVILVTHRQSMLRLATRVIILDQGRVIAQGARDDVLKSLAVAP